MKRTITALGLAMCSFAAMSQGANMDGNELLGQCKEALTLQNAGGKNISPKTSHLGGICIGKMQGITHTLALLKSDLSPDTRVCFPENGRFTNFQAARIVVKFLEDHPDMLHMNETLLSVYAFRQAFPCRS